MAQAARGTGFMSLLERFWSTDTSLTALLAFLCLDLFLLQPLGQHGVVGGLVLSMVFSLMLVSGVGAVAKSMLTTLSVGGIVLVALVLHWLRVWAGGQSLAMSDAATAAIFCIVLALVVLAQVFREGPITSHRIQGAVAVYLLLALAFASGYQLIELQWPHAFAPPPATATSPAAGLGSRFVYFSLVTLTTVGYGDISAVHPVARSLVTMEALVGQLFPAILLARLVSMEVVHRRAEHQALVARRKERIEC
jgi:voltage-gated potassium channel Kch